ncbi:hypothetical protein Pst134EA_009224 [Puccinia striiformis f. sp. tritici]|uniref:hypothetical protein n=1 Tax=Puccinia striiformis f. sp. tritici TaxID=168172 RepID=UPI0020073B12|nr:hypothetical protein Pst134EA_009224 [Puccinia striiformis f. sp. tritici]KAH9468690.1 hypothetical protein Pst134EA_009224 [Puccinia striiformis f. sp. tritici]
MPPSQRHLLISSFISFSTSLLTGLVFIYIPNYKASIPPLYHHSYIEFLYLSLSLLFHVLFFHTRQAISYLFSFLSSYHFHSHYSTLSSLSLSLAIPSIHRPLRPPCSDTILLFSI